jgi:hypothetical protein
MQNHPLSDKYIFCVFNLIRSFFDQKHKIEWYEKEDINLHGKSDKEHENKFAIHGGCIRDFYANCDVVDYDIIFDTKTNMNKFVDCLHGFPISPQTLKMNDISQKNYRKNMTIIRNSFEFTEYKNFSIKCSTGNKYSNFGYKIELTFENTKYILDICCAENAFLALDYTVNGLYLDSDGTLQSKSKKYSTNTIIKHIDDKNLISVDPKEDNNTGLFELGVKRFLKTFFHKYGQEAYEKIKERRKQKMLSKGYEEFKYFFPNIDNSFSQIIIL